MILFKLYLFLKIGLAHFFNVLFQFCIYLFVLLFMYLYSTDLLWKKDFKKIIHKMVILIMILFSKFRYIYNNLYI